MAADWSTAIGAAITMVGTGFAAAWAESVIGSATIGAIAENERLFGPGLVLTVIPETIVVFGLVIAMKLVGIF